METVHEIRDELRGSAKSLREEIPEVLAAYARLATASLSDGELPSITKEFAALAIAITKECDGCIVAHVRNLRRLGATRHQVAELIGVTILMNGGPGTVWGPRALAAFDQVVAAASESAADAGGPKK